MIKPEALAKMTPCERIDVMVHEAEQLFRAAEDAWFSADDEGSWIYDLKIQTQAFYELIRQYQGSTCKENS